MTYEVGSRYPKPGEKVRIVQKKDYDSGTLTEGIVAAVLTKKEFHPRGHKVRLTNGIIGRVQEFVDHGQEVKDFTPPPPKPKEQIDFKPEEDELV